MKKILLVLITFYALTNLVLGQKNLSNPENFVLSETERTWLTEQLTQSRDKFSASVAKLTEAQLKFKPDSTKWSIAEVLEHIALAENGLASFNQLFKSQLNPKNGQKLKLRKPKFPLF